MKYDSHTHTCEVEDGDEIARLWDFSSGARIPIPEGYTPCLDERVGEGDMIFNPRFRVFEVARRVEIQSPVKWYHLVIRKQTDPMYEHQVRHRELHRCFDELLADYITQTGKSIGNTSIMELLEWAGAQAEAVTHPVVKT